MNRTTSTKSNAFSLHQLLRFSLFLLLLLFVILPSLHGYEVLTWGANAMYQAGSNTFAANLTTPESPKLYNYTITRLVAGYKSVVAEKMETDTNGVPTYSLLALGENSNGQLGTNNPSSLITTWTPVVSMQRHEPFVSIACGAGHVIAMDGRGNVYGWGNSAAGQTGYGGTSNRLIPQLLDSSEVDRVCALFGPCSLADIIQIDAGEVHTLAVTKDGYVISWGSNIYGQLGYDTGADTYSATPMFVTDAGPSNSPIGVIVSVSAGGLHSLALHRDGRVFGWGYNSMNQAGSSSSSPVTIPTEVDPAILTPTTNSMYGAVSISAGSTFSFAVRGLISGPDEDNSLNGLLFWGYNQQSTWLGNAQASSPTANQAVPCFPSTGTITNIVAGAEHAATIMDGNILSWGSNLFNVLNGTYSATQSNCEIKKSFAPKAVVQVALGRGLTAALLDDHSVSFMGSLAQPSSPQGAPQIVNNSLSMEFTKTASGRAHTIGLRNDGNVMGWGSNSNCQANTVREMRHVRYAMQVPLISDISMIAANGDVSYAYCQSTTKVYKWGLDYDDTKICSPVEAFMIDHLSDMTNQAITGATLTSMSAGFNHLLLLIDNGGKSLVFVHGITNNGAVSRAEQVDLMDSRAAIQVAAGKDISMVLLADGDVLAWGGPYFQSQPTLISNLPSPVQLLSAKYLHCALLTQTGQVFLIGNDNTYGHLGDTSNIDLSRPEPFQLDISAILDAEESSVYEVVATEKNTYVLTTKGTVWAWGDNSENQIPGVSGTTTSPVLVNMPQNKRIYHIDGGSSFALSQVIDFECNGVKASEDNVCSGHGFCHIINNDCVCRTGYSGIDCEIYSCYGFEYTNPRVCSSYGTCNSVNNCTCLTKTDDLRSYGYIEETASGQVCDTIDRIAVVANNITSDTTLNAYTISGTTYNMYKVKQDIYVQAGATLTISPNITLLFEPGARLTVQGKLIAIGTESNKIHFTTASPTLQQWKSIRFENANTGSRIEHATFNAAGADSMGNIELFSSAVTLSNIDFASSPSSGIYNCKSLFSYSAITGNTAHSLIFHQTRC